MNERIISTLKKVAIPAGRKSPHRCKVGAVVFDKSRVIGIGYNKNKTHPMLSSLFRYGTIHAEIDACLSVENEALLKGSSIFVHRELANGGPGLAKPCPMCLQVLKKMGIKTAYWTTQEFPYWDYARVDDLYAAIDFTKAYDTNCKVIPKTF